MALPLQRSNIGSDLVTNIDTSQLSKEQKEELAIRILQKLSAKRTPNEIEFLKKHTEGIQFFKKIIAESGFNTHDLICQNMYYLFVPEQQFVFEAGSMGTTFYVILKGSVGVIINTPKEGENKLVSIEVAKIPAGGSFGELSLIEAQLKPRAASIICKEDCHFAVLDKKPYQQILGLSEKKKINIQVDFLIGLPIFSSWPRHSLKPMIYLFKQRTHNKGYVIYKEGDSDTNIYAIRSGEVKFTKKITIKPRGDDEILLDEKSQVYTYEKYPVQKIIEFVVIGANQFFGEDEAFYEVPREMTAIVSSLTAEIWVIAKKELIRKVHLYDRSYKMLVQTCQSKKEHREARVKEMLRIANEKIDMDLLIGSSNIHKKAISIDVETRLKQKFYSRRQAEEKILYQTPNVGAINSQNLSLPNAAKDHSRPITSHSMLTRDKSSLLAPTRATSASFNTQLFYYNDFNNSDLRNFLNSKLKIQDDDDDMNKSRTLYAPSFRASTSQPSRRSLKYDMDAQSLSTHQKPGECPRNSFYEPEPNFENKIFEEQNDCNKSYLLIESPTISSQVPKGWNLNHSERNKTDRGAAQQVLGKIETGSARDIRIRKTSKSESFSDAQSMMDHTLMIKKKIQEKLKSESFAKESKPSIMDYYKVPVKNTKTHTSDNIHSLTSSPKPRHIHDSQNITMYPKMLQEQEQKEDSKVQIDNDEDASVRKRISSREDEHNKEFGKINALMSFLPSRIRQNSGPCYAKAVRAEFSAQAKQNERNLKDSQLQSGKNKRSSSQGASQKPNSGSEIYRNRLFEFNVMQKYKKNTLMMSNNAKKMPKLTEEEERAKLLATYEKFKSLRLNSRAQKR